MTVHQEGSREWILKKLVLKKFFLLLAEKILVELAFTEGCVNSTELLFACCSSRNVGRGEAGQGPWNVTAESCVLEFDDCMCFLFFLTCGV